MRNFAMVAAMAGLFGGCIIYDEEIVYDTAGGDVVTDPNGGGEDTAPAFELWVDPGGAVVGDTVIVSVKAEGEVDLTSVAEVQFLGTSGVSVIAAQSRSTHEFLLTVTVPAGAALGDNDLLVKFADGTAAYVDAAFVVVSSADQIPADTHTDGSGGGDGC